MGIASREAMIALPDIGVRPKDTKIYLNSIYSKPDWFKEKKSAHPKMGKPGI
jgi:hypothetical protein